jgi:saccharopine dehydrogenase-like NADP-dependent oxidoreductase
LINDFKPELVLNVALPYQDLHIMDACLETGVDYLDSADHALQHKPVSLCAIRQPVD